MRKMRMVVVVAAMVGLGVGAMGQGAGVAVPATTGAAASEAGYKSDPKFVKAFAAARETMHHGRGYELMAADDYKRANKIVGGRCMECMTNIYNLQMKTGEYKDAQATAAALVELAESPVLKGRFGVQRAKALQYQAGPKPKPQLLEEEDRVLKQVEVDDPKNPAAYYMDGRVLAFLNRDEGAKGQFMQFAALAPRDALAVRARHFAEDPQLSRQPMAPAFVVDTLDGQHFSLDEMGGKVVLVDFWATWCGPCNEELPHMRELAKKYEGKPFVMISISWDSDKDEQKWKDFIAKNGMTWLQYRDAGHKLSTMFAVEAIPHYFTIDSDGVLQSEKVGSGADIDGKIKKLVGKAQAALAAQAMATDKGGN